MSTLRDNLIRLATLYAEATGVRAKEEGRVPLSGISTRIFNDGKTLDRIVAGRDIVTGSYERALQWFSDNWPDAASWPDHVIRPPQTDATAEALAS